MLREALLLALLQRPLPRLLLLLGLLVVPAFQCWLLVGREEGRDRGRRGRKEGEEMREGGREVEKERES